MAAFLVDRFQKLETGRRRVCLCLEDRAAVAAALLAALISGVTLLLPYALSENILAEMKEWVGFDAAVADEKQALPPNVERIVPKKSPLGWKSDFAKRMELDAELLQLFTGGSTGKPKIWAKTVRNMFSEVFYQVGSFTVSHRDSIVATVPPYHIYGLLFSVLVPFAAGASVADRTPVFPNEILATLEEAKATILVSIPMHYRVLRGGPVSRQQLRLAMSSAGVLDGEDGDAFHRATGIGVTEIYGSTETGGIATRCSANGERGFKPFDNVAWKIAGQRLHVRSAFISPGVPLDEDGFFTTGDRAKFCGEDRFVLLGRSDGIVKVGGKRVDLGEICDKTRALAGVRDAAAVAIPVEGGRENEIAVMVEGEAEATSIRHALAEVLEPYAVPRTIQVVAKMPATPAGKYQYAEIERLLRDRFLHIRKESSL